MVFPIGPEAIVWQQCQCLLDDRYLVHFQGRARERQLVGPLVGFQLGDSLPPMKCIHRIGAIGDFSQDSGSGDGVGVELHGADGV
ncbi:MAG: hypothetical protein U1G07_20180 [Verrucomicrobiota bacterium]